MLSVTALMRIAANVVAKRNKGLFKRLKSDYPNVPDYVLKQVYSGGEDNLAKSDTYEQMLKTYNRMKWKLEKIDLHWDKLNGITKSNIRRRKFGLENPDEVPDDAERLKRQVESLAGQGKNEPMVFTRTEGGLELVEGFHRTMALLLKGAPDLEKAFAEVAKASDRDLDKTASAWKPVPAEAWVGTPDPDEKEEEIDLGEGDFF